MNYEQLIACAMFTSSFAHFFTSMFFYCVNNPHMYSTLYKVADKYSWPNDQFLVNEDRFYASNLSNIYSDFAYFPSSEKEAMKEFVKEMFYHSYNGYMEHAFPLDELNPINCSGRGADPDKSNIHLNDALGNYSLTLIDALDTLYVMGDLDEFSRGVRLVSENVDFDTDTNVQVFEANIRVLGGLLSAHILASSEADSPKHHHSKKSRQGSSKKAQAKEPSLHKYKSSRKASSKSSSSGTLVDGYNNELYDLALDLASRLLPAFHESHAGLPYPRVNLRHGVTEEPYLRQNINCLAGVGTLSLEFGLLSHLSGDPVYERVARNALRSVWDMRNNETFLFGNSFDIHSKQWHSGLSGLGAGMDSFYEYLIKAYVMFNEQDYLLLFNEMYRLVSYFNKEGRHRCLSPSLRSGDPSGPPIFRNVDYRSGQLLTNWIDSLQAAWPGILVLFGDIEEAICQHALHFAIWQKYSALPERFNLVHQTSEVHFYPLRPELAESTYLLYRATKSPFYLHVGRIIAEDINKYTRTSCGFATLKDVKSKTLEDRMESFVLSETFKYLYLLFDEENELHSSNMAGKFLFSTEGHILPVLKYISPHHNLTSASWFSPPQPLPVDRAFSRPDLTCEAVPFLYQHSMPLPPHMLYQIEGIVGLHS